MSKSRKMTPEIQQEFSRLMSVDPDHALKPKAMVRAAEAPTSPLHRFFTWDDAKAAEQYRLEQARDLIQSFTTYSEEVDSEVRVLTSLDIDRDGGVGYRWTTEVLERPNLREQYLQTALDELDRVRVRYEHVEQLYKIWADIKKAKKAHTAKASKAEKKTQHRTIARQATKKVSAPKKRTRPTLTRTQGFVARPA